MRLQGLDATFLYMETPQTPMHVAGYTLFDLPEHWRGRFYENYRAFLVPRLKLAPLFTRKLRASPMQIDHPAWVEDDQFDLDFHLRSMTLPGPGNWEQLEDTVARLHGELLDRTRPLWQFTVIEGLADGRGALYSKVHHAALDGGAGMVLTKAMYDVTPQPRTLSPVGEVKRPYATPEPVSPAALLGGLGSMYMNFVRQQIDAIAQVPAMMKAVNNVLLPKLGEDAKLTDLIPIKSLSRLPPLIAPKTPFNAQITGDRAYAARPLPLALAKKIGKATGTKMNDVVMAICAGALRRYLDEKDALPRKQLVAFVPVSLRELGNTDMNNQVTGMMCGLATQIADPIERLQAIAAAAVGSKSLTADVKDASPKDFSFVGAPVLLSGLAKLFGRSGAANWMRFPFNVVISNVQGPPVPLFCGEARVSGLYPVSIPSHGCALNVTVQSYMDELDLGLTADRRAVPDLGKLADYHRDALFELAEAAGVQITAPPLRADAAA